MEFSHELALSIVQSTDEFPIDFDAAWKWIGYSTKQKAKNKLANNFDIGFDYTLTQMVKRVEGNKGGGSVRFESINLTLDCFKSLGMMAGTQQGKEVRRYFLECERIAKQAAEIIPAQSARIRELELELQLAQAQAAAAQSQERLMQATNAIATLHGSGMVALVLGKPDALVQSPPIVVEKNILVNQAGKPLKTYEGLSKTKLAKRYGMAKPQDLVNWLQSMGKTHLIQPGITTAPCQFVPFEYVPELDRLWAARQGERQFLLGE